MLTKYIYIHFTFLQSITNPASQQAEKINRLFNSFNIAVAGMLLLVSILVIYICIKFRLKKDDTAEPAQTKGNNKLEAIMIGVPTLLLAYFFYESIAAANYISPAVEVSKQPDVIITGHQWWWEVVYPASGVIAANEVHLPVGKHLLMEMRSADVIHDWWVPELGNKMDLIPKIKNYLWLDINKAGNYQGSCSEFCGAEHAWMRINVIAQNENDFNTWLSANSKSAVPPADSLAMQGSMLFQSKTCAGCHRIKGTEAVSNVGPDLTHLFSRQEMLTGLLKMNKDNLFTWINHPQAIKPGAHMPDFIFDKDSINAIVHYLGGLK